MTVYAELLKLALADEDPADRSVEDAVAGALALKEALDAPGDAATRLAAALAYDLALARLCALFGIPHDLTGEAAGPVGRRLTEQALARFVPTLDRVMQ